MSWVSKVQTNIQITTGDGRTYSPLYFINKKTIDYNVAEFNFPEVEGTLVKRGTPKGARHSIDIIFQGENHLDESLSFENSCKDKRPWTLFHPFFGKLLVQPSSLVFDPTAYSQTLISCELTETITDEYPRISVDPTDKIFFDSQNTTAVFNETLANVPFENDDVSTLNDSTNDLFSLGSQAVKSGNQSNEYLSLYNTATSSVFSVFSDASFMATSISDFIDYPFQFEDTIQNRLNLLLSQFNALGQKLSNLVTPNDKKIYEFYAGSLVNSIIKTSINPLITDYLNAPAVYSVIDSVLSVYNSYIENLDSIQTENNGTIDSYIPSFEPLQNLSGLVNFAVSNLFTIAFGARQERTLFLENDSNVIILAHRFYGLNVNDSTIDDFINTNGIGVNEYYEILKGRKIIYYV
jgi:hypothetical protein